MSESLVIRCRHIIPDDGQFLLVKLRIDREFVLNVLMPSQPSGNIDFGRSFLVKDSSSGKRGFNIGGLEM